MLSEPQVLDLLHDAGLFPRNHPTAPRFTEELALRVVRAVEAHYERSKMRIPQSKSGTYLTSPAPVVRTYED